MGGGRRGGRGGGSGGFSGGFSSNQTQAQDNHGGKKPVCRNFLSGNCRYGSNCKFRHPFLPNWRLSCFAGSRNGPTDLPGDISPEEIRLESMLAYRQGGDVALQSLLGQYQLKANQSVERLRSHLLNGDNGNRNQNNVMEIQNNGGLNPSAFGGGNPSSSPFGAGAGTPSPFGTSAFGGGGGASPFGSNGNSTGFGVSFAATGMGAFGSGVFGSSSPLAPQNATLSPILGSNSTSFGNLGFSNNPSVAGSSSASTSGSFNAFAANGSRATSNDATGSSSVWGFGGTAQFSSSPSSASTAQLQSLISSHSSAPVSHLSAAGIGPSETASDQPVEASLSAVENNNVWAKDRFTLFQIPLEPPSTAELG